MIKTKHLSRIRWILNNPHYASNRIYAQLQIAHHGRRMVCWAFSPEDEAALLQDAREGPHDYRIVQLDDHGNKHHEVREGDGTTRFVRKLVRK